MPKLRFLIVGSNGHTVPAFPFSQIYNVSKEGGLLSKGHLCKVGTLLLPVKSLCLFKILFFLPCGPDSVAFFDYEGFVVLSSSPRQLNFSVSIFLKVNL